MNALVINGWDFLPLYIRATDTNRLWPMTCGHTHATGDTIWYRMVGDFAAYCTPCARGLAATRQEATR